ncbi:uncharacterized protein MEPE_01422 [Melanopsichium pennsylvanicum]|uniref:RNA polymerase II assembly factor Rtp1 C-terminal domain-containing protein n=2 Tax=Melanopsichium pennsylvanicum TaxID=63383 RepID=A0AAJ4XIQ6_9BASI|nr:protein required for cell viability [Melanopsichium pennsylvanicum 4]SNX82716.1 uncharacterized protein MEPE_01422 [Melanopsichium pennsylvanicum]
MSYRQTLNHALHASRILTGALDQELDISKSAITTKLGAQHKNENQAALHATLSQRLLCAVSAWHQLASLKLHSNPEIATGDLALYLLSCIHACSIQKKADVHSRVPIQVESLPGLKRKGAQPKEDVGLGIKDVKLVTTLQSLASKWALSTRIKAYDHALFSLAPNQFSNAHQNNASLKLTSQNRFEQVDERAELQQRALATAAFDTARKDLDSVIDTWVDILMTTKHSSAQAEPMSSLTDVVTVMLRVGIVDYLSSLLRLGFGPSVRSENPISSTLPPGASLPKDAIQRRSAAATTQLLRFLSTYSAISALSSVIAHLNAKLGAPSFVKSVSSRLLSAQLLRPDGVRSLLIITFGGADLAESELDGINAQSDATGTAAPGSNSLKRFEQCARLLLTPPRGMPTDVYLPIILPNLLDILAPIINSSLNITPPPQEQMRAAGFVLTRISERYPQLFYKAMDDRVYSKFRPSLPASNLGSESNSRIVTSTQDLDQAVSTLSSFLLFSEPSPTFFTILFQPVLPQLLTLYNVLSASARGTAKGKVTSLEYGGQRDRLKLEVSNFIKTWIRLVDAKQGANSLIQAIQAAESGIGYKPQNVLTPTSEADFFWSERDEGVSIRYGENPSADSQDFSALLEHLSMASLAQKISLGSDDQVDLTKFAPGLSAKLGLQPDPRLVVNLLKTADRKDLARYLLPFVLDTYTAQKSAKKAQMAEQSDGASRETRSMLYLQLILQLFDAFGANLLQGDIQATLAFIDFALSNPSQRQSPQFKDQSDVELKQDQAEEMPFISAKGSKSQPKASSLFNVAAGSHGSAQQLLGSEQAQDQPMEQDGDKDDEEQEELQSTALSLLLSLLESDTSLSTESQPMLLVIADKFEPLLDNHDSGIRSLAKEAKLVLMARRNSIRGAPLTSNLNTTTNETSAKALSYVQAQETYQEALKLLQDPILPVRAHGLVLLRRLVSDDPKSGGQNVSQVDAALIPAILDIFLLAIQDEESYLYLNAVQGLAALASAGGSQTISRLVGIYIGRDDGFVSQGLAAREVEKRLRVGEALLQVIQRCGDAMVAHVEGVVPPLLVKLRDRNLPNVLRSSFLSILGTVVEAAPLAMASKGYSAQLVEICMDIVTIELVQRRNLSRQPKGIIEMKVQGERVGNVDEDDEEKNKVAKDKEEQKNLESATIIDPKVAHLRRAAMLLLTLVVHGTRLQLQDRVVVQGELIENLSVLRLPGGGILPKIGEIGHDGLVERQRGEGKMGEEHLLLSPKIIKRLNEVVTYVEASDIDVIVRTHAHDCKDQIGSLQLDLLRTDVGLLR